MIRKIRIKNFKNLEDVEIEVKPLTLLFGPNGSGKSSLLKAMMFVSKNLFPLNCRKTIYNISEDVNLGSYEEIVRENNIKRNIVFEFDISGDYIFPKIDWLKSKFNDPELEYFQSKMKKSNIFDIMSEIHTSEIFENVNTEYFQKYFDKVNYNFTYKVEFGYSKIDYNLRRIIIEDKLNNSIYEFVSNIENADTRFSKEEFLFLNDKELSKLFNERMYLSKSDEIKIVKNKTEKNPVIFEQSFDFNHILPLQEILSDKFNKISYTRNLVFKSSKWDKLLKSEKIAFYYEIIRFVYMSFSFTPFFLNIFLNSNHIPLTRKTPKNKYLLERNEFNVNEYYGFFKILDSRDSDNKAEKINTFIKTIELGKGFKINKRHGIGSISLISSMNKPVNMAYASSGFIQVFPIIILCCNLDNIRIKDLKNYFLFKPKTPAEIFCTLLIEQPELHLHPKLQSKLADVFSETIKNSENNLFIETHSEHLIRKIQVLIAEGNLDKNKVSVMYFNNKNGVTKVENMEIDDNGLFIKDWPDGFFDDSVNLTMELFEALRKRKN